MDVHDICDVNSLPAVNEKMQGICVPIGSCKKFKSTNYKTMHRTSSLFPPSTFLNCHFSKDSGHSKVCLHNQTGQHKKGNVLLLPAACRGVHFFFFSFTRAEAPWLVSTSTHSVEPLSVARYKAVRPLWSRTSRFTRVSASVFRASQ